MDILTIGIGQNKTFRGQLIKNSCLNSQEMVFL